MQMDLHVSSVDYPAGKAPVIENADHYNQDKCPSTHALLVHRTPLNP